MREKMRKRGDLLVQGRHFADWKINTLYAFADCIWPWVALSSVIKLVFMLSDGKKEETERIKSTVWGSKQLHVSVRYFLLPLFVMIVTVAAGRGIECCPIDEVVRLPEENSGTACSRVFQRRPLCSPRCCKKMQYMLPSLLTILIFSPECSLWGFWIAGGTKYILLCDHEKSNVIHFS